MRSSSSAMRTPSRARCAPLERCGRRRGRGVLRRRYRDAAGSMMNVVADEMNAVNSAASSGAAMRTPPVAMRAPTVGKWTPSARSCRIRGRCGLRRVACVLHWSGRVRRPRDTGAVAEEGCSAALVRAASRRRWTPWGRRGSPQDRRRAALGTSRRCRAASVRRRRTSVLRGGASVLRAIDSIAVSVATAAGAGQSECPACARKRTVGRHKLCRTRCPPRDDCAGTSDASGRKLASTTLRQP